jgi:hypothetical protein
MSTDAALILGAALLLATGLVLFFTNRLFRRTLLGAVILALIGGGGWLLYVRYVQTPEEEAAEKQAADALNAEDARFLAQVDQDALEEGRWLPVAVDTQHRQYLIDLQTIESRSGVPCPLGERVNKRYVRVWIRRRTPPGTDAIEADDSHAVFSCDGNESCGAEVRDFNDWQYAPGSVAEAILHRLQESTWCGKLDTAVRDPTFLRLPVEEQL